MAEDDTSWQGVVDITPGQRIYVGLTVSVTPIGVEAHDCSNPNYSGGWKADVPSYITPVTTTTVPVTTTSTPPPPAETVTVTTSATTTTPPPPDTVTVTTTIVDPTIDARLSAVEQRQQVDEARIATLEQRAGIILGEPKNVAPFTAPTV